MKKLIVISFTLIQGAYLFSAAGGRDVTAEYKPTFDADARYYSRSSLAEPAERNTALITVENQTGSPIILFRGRYFAPIFLEEGDRIKLLVHSYQRFPQYVPAEDLKINSHPELISWVSAKATAYEREALPKGPLSLYEKASQDLARIGKGFVSINPPVSLRSGDKVIFGKNYSSTVIPG